MSALPPTQPGGWGDVELGVPNLEVPSALSPGRYALLLMGGGGLPASYCMGTGCRRAARWGPAAGEQGELGWGGLPSTMIWASHTRDPARIHAHDSGIELLVRGWATGRRERIQTVCRGIFVHSHIFRCCPKNFNRLILPNAGSTRLNKELGTSHGVSSVIDNENNVTRDATKRAATALILSTYSHLAKDEWAVGCWRRWAAPDRHREELRAGGAVRQRSKSPAPRQRGIEKVGRRFRSPCCCNRGRMKMLNRKMLKRKMLNLAMKFGKVLVFVLVFTPDMLTQAKLEEDELTLDLSAESLETFFAALRLKLIKYCLTDTRAGHHILKNNIYAERFKPPSMWIKVNLWDGEDFKGALYFRSDSLYLLAFANKGGTVFYMKGHEKTFELLNDAVALPFGEAYDELTDKLGEELVSDLLQLVTLGQEPARMAANDLAEYDGVDKPDQIAVKRALLTFTILIAESMRTKDIRARCIQYWKGCTRLTSLEAQQTLLWNKLCEIFFSKPEYVATDPVTKYRNVMGTIAVTHMSDIDNIVDFLIDRRKPGPAPPPPATVRKAGRAPRPPPSATVQQEVAYRQQYFWKRILTHPPPEPTPASAPPHVRVPPHVLSPPTPWPAMSDVGASAAAMPPHADQKNY